jgi:hypothetical protein
MGTNMIASVLFTPPSYWYGPSVSGRFRPDGNRFRAGPAKNRVLAGPMHLRGAAQCGVSFGDRQEIWPRCQRSGRPRPGRGSPDGISPAGINLWQAPSGLQVGRSDPHHSSGNGRNGQASPLSFAAACGWWKVGSMAALTASSNRSNSTSLIALFECAGTIRIAIIHKISMRHC